MSNYGCAIQARYLGCAFILGLSQTIPEIWGERHHPFILCQQTQSTLVQMSNQPAKKKERKKENVL